MKNKKMILGIVLMVVFTISAVNCSSQSLNSPEALKEYLNKQAGNSPDKPIKVSMVINDPMLPKIVDVINSAGKYVSLNITGNALTTIPEKAFRGCGTLVNITLPNSVISIEYYAFRECTNLTSVTIPSSVTSIDGYAFGFCTNLTSVTFQSKTELSGYSFDGDLDEKYLAGGIGTYIVTEKEESKGVLYPAVWKKQ